MYNGGKLTETTSSNNPDIETSIERLQKNYNIYQIFTRKDGKMREKEKTSATKLALEKKYSRIEKHNF